jgi:hypothetical protein
MIKLKRHTDWLDFNPGGVPAGIIFDHQVEDACKLMDMCPSGKFEDMRSTDVDVRVVTEFAFIGLIAYFEGFCKNHTAAIINICPQLVRGLAERGREIKLRPIDILDYGENLHTQFGFLVVEKIDFGTAKAINGFYYDLLGITPLSKREANRFHALLEDRHLIVHHGNIFTPNYASERFIRREVGRSRIFMDSLPVTKKDVRTTAQFLQGLSVKLRDASCHALTAFVKRNRLRLAKPNREAIKFLDTKTPIQK